MNWSTKTLDQLEDADWGDPTYQSYVVTNSHKLRKKPLCDFTPEDLRFMLIQQISLPILMPMALDVLEKNAFIGGDMYTGDLLNAALRVDSNFWREHPRLWYRLHVVTAEIDSIVKALEEELLPALTAFQKCEPPRDAHGK